MTVIDQCKVPNSIYDKNATSVVLYFWKHLFIYSLLSVLSFFHCYFQSTYSLKTGPAKNGYFNKTYTSRIDKYNLFKLLLWQIALMVQPFLCHLENVSFFRSLKKLLVCNSFFCKRRERNLWLKNFHLCLYFH